MNPHGSCEREHPMFRVLVLMGGTLALGCGGSAIIESPADGSGGTKVGGAPEGGAELGGGGASARAGGSGSGGSGGSGTAGAADCPPAQWDCSGVSQTCSYSLPGTTRPAGCLCDPKRPRSVADCAPNENLLCLSAYRDKLYPEPQNWDGYLHVQCACRAGPTLPSYDTCQNECGMAYPTLAAGAFETVVSCNLPPAMTCDPSGNNCTATAASVLRQDGIVCGCASITLK